MFGISIPEQIKNFGHAAWNFDTVLHYLISRSARCGGGANFGQPSCRKKLFRNVILHFVCMPSTFTAMSNLV